MLHDDDKAKADRTLSAVMEMTKLDLKTLEQAHDGTLVQSGS
jgi:hypothetical protein